MFLPFVFLISQQPAAQVLHLSDATIPVFRYPNILRIALIQGDFTFRTQVQNGVIGNITQVVGQKQLLSPHLRVGLENQIHQIKFPNSASGNLELTFNLKLVGEPAFPEDEVYSISIHPKSNLVSIEMSPAKATICDAPSK